MAAYRQSHIHNARAVNPTLDAAMKPRHPDAVSESLREVWHQFVSTVFDSYRPERHYMRGPGPACAAKRRNSLT